mgnify:CR=1 FL=1
MKLMFYYSCINQISYQSLTVDATNPSQYGV